MIKIKKGVFRRSAVVADGVDTTKVSGRRVLRFGSLDDVAADVELLARAREIRALGNWSAGQNLAHVAIMMTRSLDGFPSKMPWYMRIPVRLLLKGQLLNKAMPAGFKAPAAAASVPGAVTLEEGLAAIRGAVGRLKAETQRAASPMLGRLSVEEWDRLHCRHAELHLSFLVPVE